MTGIRRAAQRDEPTTWDAEYSAGRWDYLGDPEEEPRYAILATLIAHDGERRSILDLGCGTGILHRHVAAGAIERYTGVDVSAEAVARAAEEATEGAEFLAADIRTWQPDGDYDVIVFNEVLYYLREPRDVLRRYAGHLTHGGTLLVSMYVPSPVRAPHWRRRAGRIWRIVGRDFEVLSKIRLEVPAARRSWRIWRVRPRGVRPSRA